MHLELTKSGVCLSREVVVLGEDKLWWKVEESFDRDDLAVSVFEVNQLEGATCFAGFTAGIDRRISTKMQRMSTTRESSKDPNRVEIIVFYVCWILPRV